jgi:hypothetical protein
MIVTVAVPVASAPIAAATDIPPVPLRQAAPVLLLLLLLSATLAVPLGLCCHRRRCRKRARSDANEDQLLKRC